MTSSHILVLLAILFVYNIFVFAVFWRDKNAARKGAWRVSENTLLLSALFAGSPGALAARKLLRHKTRKQPFASRLNAIAVLHGITLLVICTVLVAPDQTRRLINAIRAVIA